MLYLLLQILDTIVFLLNTTPHSSASTYQTLGPHTLSMDFIPQVLLTHIVRRVGKIGFRELGPLIASGPDFKTLVFDHIVLDDVDTNEYIFVSRLANKGSITRPFLLRCLDAGNETAHYVEGLRFAAQEGPSQRSIDLISVAAPITFMLTSL